jgi:hypothetical protein
VCVCVSERGKSAVMALLRHNFGPLALVCLPNLQCSGLTQLVRCYELIPICFPESPPPCQPQVCDSVAGVAVGLILLDIGCGFMQVRAQGVSLSVAIALHNNHWREHRLLSRLGELRVRVGNKVTGEGRGRRQNYNIDRVHPAPEYILQLHAPLYFWYKLSYG